MATTLLISCGDGAGPDQDALPEPGTSGPEFVTMTRDGAPWVPETSTLFMVATVASFGWDRDLPDGTKTSFAGSFRLRHRTCC